MAILQVISNIIFSAFIFLLDIIAYFLIDTGNETISIKQAIDYAVSVCQQFNFVIDWYVVFSVLRIIIMAELAIFIYKFIMWLINLVKGN